MRAIQIARLDGPSAAELNEIPEPDAAGAVVIEVHAAGVAFPDALQSRGLYQHKPELPYTPGAELAGVVRSAPEGAHVASLFCQQFAPELPAKNGVARSWDDERDAAAQCGEMMGFARQPVQDRELPFSADSRESRM